VNHPPAAAALQAADRAPDREIFPGCLAFLAGPNWDSPELDHSLAMQPGVCDKMGRDGGNRHYDRDPAGAEVLRVA
jgi:hypothetical protein